MEHVVDYVHDINLYTKIHNISQMGVPSNKIKGTSHM